MNDVLSGQSRIALAITEPEAGSDVRGLQTEAVLSNNGAHLIINGQKKVFSLVFASSTFSSHALVFFRG